METEKSKFSKETFTKLLTTEGFEPLETFEKKIVPGVYVIFNNDGVKYIGQSNNVKKRIKEHIGIYSKESDYVYIKRIFSREERLKEEAKYIQKFLPIINSATDKLIELKKELSEDYRRFRIWLDQFPISRRTYNLYCKIIKNFLDNLEIRLSIDIGNPHYDIVEEVNRFLKKHKRYYYFNALKYFLKFKEIDHNEVIKIKEPKKTIKEVPNLDKIEYILKKIKKHCDEDTYWVLKIMYITGARISEILNLKLNDIGTDHIIFKITKTQEERKVYVYEEIIKELRYYLIEIKGIFENEKCFYTNYKNEEVAYIKLREKLNKLVKEGVITKKELQMVRRTHNFRRAVINHILESTNNILSAQTFIGHANIGTTMKYVAEWAKEKALKDACMIMEKRYRDKLIEAAFRVVKEHERV